MEDGRQTAVKMWEQEVVIPTYGTGEPDKNPMFLEKRVYQGSSGKVYPLPVIDKICDEKQDKTYRAVFLENEYLQIMILPELGGRIQRALDKTNNYDFVYYNQVIKPALVGLAGPWISGGIEFNWPQHHRPSTFAPVEYVLKENEDGSKTVWVSEIDQMYRTKGLAGFTLHPGKAYLEIRAQLYNRTEEPQTFLWWANPAVAVNDHTQSVFPPDVTAVFDHGKRDVSRFPIATGTYYKVDYSAGVDISRYKNIQVPTSYMAWHSDYNFVGGYDHALQAGLLHVADHHVSPGKKQWTWGCGDFGQAWDRNLTDEDGPYIELMTGVFTDNQPDFTWLNPYEEKTFTQYFMPYKTVGMVKNATVDVAVGLEKDGDHGYRVSAYATSEMEGVSIRLTHGNAVLLEEVRTLSPVMTFEARHVAEGVQEQALCLTLTDAAGKLLIRYQPEVQDLTQVPDAAQPIPSPEAIPTTEGLFLAGQHLEQYRHATYEPEAYYLEGLKRDPGDIRLNNAYGLLLFRRGRFADSEVFFRNAVKTATRHNGNPYDGEPLFHLGLTLSFQERWDEAYDVFYKACWNVAMQDAGYFALARIAVRRGDLGTALAHLDKSLCRNSRNYKARHLRTAVLRLSGDTNGASRMAEETLTLDVADYGACRELQLLAQRQGDAAQAARYGEQLVRLLRGSVNNYLELAIDYAAAGLYGEACEVLEACRCTDAGSKHPMVAYYLGVYLLRLDRHDGQDILHLAAGMSTDYVFPNKLEDIPVLQTVMTLQPEDWKAAWYLGNLWYDRRQYEAAVSCWEASRALNPDFATTHRNLALAYFNKQGNARKAREAMETAFARNPGDARVFLELDQLCKRLGDSPEARLARFGKHAGLVGMRDDLYVEYITLLNLTGQHALALEKMMGRTFHPWEGGEGKITTQYVTALVELSRAYLADGRFAEAEACLKRTERYPHHLGEGKLYGAQENHVNYYRGLALEGLGDMENARMYLEKAAVGLDEPTSAMFYNDQPPEMIFYQGMALDKLGRRDKAQEKYHKLLSYGGKHLDDHVTIDYFAVSLPDFLIFEDDLDRKNQIHCRYLMALGHLGLGDKDLAMEAFCKVLETDAGHGGAILHRKMAYD